MQPCHLGAPVVDQDRAVLVDVHEGTGLVEGRQVEGDAELDRRHRQGALAVRVGGVERLDLALAVGDVGAGDDLVPDRRDALGVADRLPVGRCLAGPVEVALAQVHRVQTEQRRAAAEDVLDHQHALGAAEAAEGGVRGLVCLGDAAVHPDVGDPVGVVDVAQRARQDRLREVEAPAAVSGQGGVQGEDASVLVEADPPVGVEPVPLARHGQVLRAVQPQPDRAPGERRTQRGDRRKPVRLHLLAAEAAAHAQALHRDVVVVPAQHVGHDLLRLGRVLGAALDEDLAVLVDVRQRAVSLEVEVLLAGELELAAVDVTACGEAGLQVAAAPVGGALEDRPRSPRSP